MKISATRPTEFQRILSWLDTRPEPGRVDICGLSGYGGVGKSFLLRHVLEQVKPGAGTFLEIFVDGSDPAILGDLMAIYQHRLSPRSLARGKPNCDYFPHARSVSIEHAAMMRDAIKSIDAAGVSDDIKKAAKTILRGGSVLNKAIPRTRDYVDFDFLQKVGVPEALDEALDLLGKTPTLIRRMPLPGVIKDIVGITASERLRDDLFRLAAEEWVADLCAILNRYRRRDWGRLTHSPIEGLDRLLLVIDDFEMLGKTIHAFLTTALIPELERANFHTTMIILGRDDLADASLAFQHHYAHLVRDKLRLEPFTVDVASAMFLEAGYSESELPALLEESHGYPFLVSLLCEAKGGNVSFYQQFFERTTRWMGPKEKEWVLPLCYLQRITEGSIATMLPSEPAKLVHNWFSHEASLRDPSGDWYVIAPYIRRTLIEYHKRKIGTKASEELVRVGERASKEA